MTIEMIDPYFHEFRKYMSPVVHKGKQTIGYFASCKQSGCGYSSGWASEIGRNIGMWRHRSVKIVAQRHGQLTRLHGNDSKAIISALEDLADNQTHTYENWAETVKTIIRRKLGLAGEGAVDQIPKSEAETYYHLGYTALTVADRAIQVTYEVS